MKLLRSLVPTPLRLLAAKILPLPSRLTRPTVKDIHSHSIREGLFVHVYRLVEPTGPGLGVSVVAFTDEVMRFDCFGASDGHMHLNIKQNRGYPGSVARLYFREQTIQEQIERSCFELEHNLSYALKTNASSRLRRLQLQPAELQGAVSFMRDTMNSVLIRYEPELSTRLADSPPMGDTPDEVL